MGRPQRGWRRGEGRRGEREKRRGRVEEEEEEREKKKRREEEVGKVRGSCGDSEQEEVIQKQRQL